MNVFRVLGLSGLLYSIDCSLEPIIRLPGNIELALKCYRQGVYIGHIRQQEGPKIYRRHFSWNMTPSGIADGAGSIQQYAYPSHLFEWWPE